MSDKKDDEIIPNENPNNENKSSLNMGDDIFVKETNNTLKEKNVKKHIHDYIIHEPLKLGKKIYISEFISEFVIKSVAFISIAVILAIFYYVFQESVYAFYQEAKKTTTEEQQSPTNPSKSDSGPESYGGSVDNSLQPESYGGSTDNSFQPESYGGATDNSLQPESYGGSADNSLQPESYGGTEEVVTKDKSNVTKSEMEQNTQDSIDYSTSTLQTGRASSQGVESAGGDKVITLKGLFSPNDVIDGKKEYIWQPISQVPKFSLIPLAVGALKVTMIGILIAAPLSILAALFTTAFAPRWLKEIMKPAIEILAGFPSVVLGFFCLITLSTLVQNVFGTTYRLNSFVGGLGMALAVIPIIYTVTEDALSAIPKYMKEASLALGASRWQTAYKVILPAATPGVFAAVILGFGRAFGETMIALMATGNAALVSGNIFESVRTMAATIGAEMAEVDFHGVHYGILFLIGALLFVVTFVLNAIAEFYVRNKLLKKFQGK